MSFLSKIFGGGINEVLGGVDTVLSRFKLAPEDKEKFKIELEGLLQKRDSEIEQTIRAELAAKERVLVAELNQGDAFTKRARPSVVYAGLFFILFNYCVVPTLQSLSGVTVEAFELPGGFWAAWSGLVATWSIGRSAEKRGAREPWVQKVTGSRLLDAE